MRPIPAPRLGDAHGLLRAISQRERIRLDEFVTEFSIDELFPPGLENALGRTRQFVSFARAAGLVTEDRGVVELTEIGKRYVKAADPQRFFDVSSGQAEWLRRQLREKHMTDSIYHGAAIGLSLLASSPPDFRVSTLDFGRALAYLARAGWDNENTFTSQGERYTVFLTDLELIDQRRRLTATGDALRAELTLPIHMSLKDLAGQLNPGGVDAAIAEGESEWTDREARAPAAAPAAEAPTAPPAAAPEDEYEEFGAAVAAQPAAAPQAPAPQPVASTPAEPPAVPQDVWDIAAPDEVTRAYGVVGPDAPTVAPPPGEAPPGEAPAREAPAAPAAPPASAPPPSDAAPAGPTAQERLAAEAATRLSVKTPTDVPAVAEGPATAALRAAAAAPPGGGPVAPPGGAPVAPPGGAPVAPPGGAPVAPPGGAPVAPPGGAPVAPPGGVSAPPPGGVSAPPPGAVSEPPAPAPAGAPPAVPTPARRASGFLDLAAARGAGEEAGLSLPAAVYAAAVAALGSGRHLVLVGPAGSGKTTLALALARAATAAGRSQGALLVTAQRRWSARDTLGRTGDGGLEAGHVLTAAQRERWLVADELDRAHLDRALGALSTFLGGLPVTLPDGSESMPPADWRIVATSEAPLRGSAALLRRFAHVNVLPPSDQELGRLIDHAAGGDATAAGAARRLLAVRELRDLGAGVFLAAARHAAERNALEPAAEAELARECLAAYVRPLLGPLEPDAESRLRALVP